MSSINFTTRAGEARVGGPERFSMAIICSDMLLMAVRGLTPAYIVKIMTPGHYLYEQAQRVLEAKVNPPPEASYAGTLAYKAEQAFEESLKIFFRSCFDDDEPFPGFDLFSITLNTALALGSAPVKLGARIHGQCEIHCWVDGPDRAWLADVIQEGRTIGLFRDEMGWEAVLELLRASDADPVVLSSSVTDDFPGTHLAAGLEPPVPDLQGRKYEDLSAAEKEANDTAWEDREEAWEALTDDQRWDMSMQALRDLGNGLQIKPADFTGEFQFDNGATGFDLVRAARKESGDAR